MQNCIDERRPIILQQFRWRQFSISFGEFRFWIKKIEMAGRSCLKDVDHPFGFRNKVWQSRRERIARFIFRQRSDRVRAAKHRQQRHRPKIHAAIAQKPAAADETAELDLRNGNWFHDQFFVSVSSRFNRTRLTIVQAASCFGLVPGGNSGSLPSPTATSRAGIQPSAMCCLWRTQQFKHGGNLGWFRRVASAQAKRICGTLFISAATFTQGAQGQRLRSFNENRFI